MRQGPHYKDRFNRRQRRFAALCADYAWAAVYAHLYERSTPRASGAPAAALVDCGGPSEECPDGCDCEGPTQLVLARRRPLP